MRPAAGGAPVAVKRTTVEAVNKVRTLPVHIRITCDNSYACCAGEEGRRRSQLPVANIYPIIRAMWNLIKYAFRSMNHVNYLILYIQFPHT
jgi:hypothetical protein